MKRNLWKVGIAIAGMLLLLAFMMWFSVPASDAQGGTLGSATPGTVTAQATPTVDATVIALNKEKLMQEVQQLQQSNNRGLGNWLWSYAAVVLSSFLSTLVVVIGVLIGFRQWSIGRQDAQDKDLKAQAEERFKTAVTALGDEKESVQVGGAILLRSFLNKDDQEIYGRYYTQIFDLAVAYLRPSGTSQRSGDSDTPLPLTTLRQALIVVFKEAFPLARPPVKRSPQPPRVFGRRPPLVTTGIQSLDASGIQLDKAYLASADLKQAWMIQASLRGATLIHADLSEANLGAVDLRGVLALRADLSQAYLMKAKLSRAELNWANLSGAKLMDADLRGTRLNEADLSYAQLTSADLSGAELCGADLTRAFLVGADLSGANIEDAKSLQGTLLGATKGLTKEQIASCKAKGAVLGDEASMISASQPTVVPPSARPAQWSLLPPNADESSTTSSKSSSEP